MRFGERLALRLRVSPLVIGLTIVSLGTSAPELAVGIDSMLRGYGSLVVGNVAGSNIVNILFVGGLAAVIIPIAIDRQVLRQDLPAMGIASVLALLVVLDGELSVLDGVVLLLAGAVYTWILLRGARRDPALAAELAAEGGADLPGGRWRVAGELMVLLASIGVVVVGADWFVTGAIEAAEALGVSETMIGLTVVAIGTSMPELCTTLVALIRGKKSLAIGNLIGSSIYNLTLVLGGSLLFVRGTVAIDPQLVRVDLPILIGIAVLCGVTFFTGRKLSRLEGALFLAAYGTYLGFLIANPPTGY